MMTSLQGSHPQKENQPISDLNLKSFVVTHEDKLDGIKLGKRKRSPSPQTMEDFLQLAGESSRPLIPGQKRVRWADIEERKEQMRRREIGFG
ncbi:hypothetical protein KUTeg_013369 [Tegillarca granosa]|uniref:Uncharacterized protein n=1 Tax=Tegillarca granosa TaxID=220873 RepID=A0ABQ9ETK5_TEGGR|nr:hypothetical protein KUTeg_013369 [Tegillarca granosa]